ncbi:hypothetical protein K438DRAFT_1963666 [Mycena galopus ATCC 62051]|nr:hypothetical protein K438DRAFT_1963666 [Mycena galopus ATCC 62051]
MKYVTSALFLLFFLVPSTSASSSHDIYNAAKGDKKKIVRAFRQALTDDTSAPTVGPPQPAALRYLSYVWVCLGRAIHHALLSPLPFPCAAPFRRLPPSFPGGPLHPLPKPLRHPFGSNTFFTGTPTVFPSYHGAYPSCAKQARRQVLDDNVADTFQQEVDDLLAIGVADTATSGQAQGGNV